MPGGFVPDPLRSERPRKLIVPIIRSCSRHLAQITPTLLRTSEEADRPSRAHSVVATLQKRATRKAIRNGVWQFGFCWRGKRRI